MVREVDGQLVLDDPDALAVIRAVAKHNCRLTFEAQREHVDRWARRIVELGQSPRSVVIVVLNVDDPNGSEVANALMPNSAALWDGIRARGETPFARGLVSRRFTELLLRRYDPEAFFKLETIELGVVVMDHGVAEVFPHA